MSPISWGHLTRSIGIDISGASLTGKPVEGQLYPPHTSIFSDPASESSLEMGIAKVEVEGVPDIKFQNKNTILPWSQILG